MAGGVCGLRHEEARVRLLEKEASEPVLVGAAVTVVQGGDQKGLGGVTVVCPLRQTGEEFVWGQRVASILFLQPKKNHCWKLFIQTLHISP